MQIKQDKNQKVISLEINTMMEMIFTHHLELNSKKFAGLTMEDADVGIQSMVFMV